MAKTLREMSLTKGAHWSEKKMCAQGRGGSSHYVFLWYHSLTLYILGKHLPTFGSYLITLCHKNAYKQDCPHKTPIKFQSRKIKV